MFREMKILAAALVFVAFLGFIVFMVYKNWTTGGSESDYEVICLGGHQYHRANWANKALLGIVLTDAGRPINCLK